MTKLPRRIKIVIAFFVIMVGGGVLTYLSAVPRGISPAFTEARMQGALIAQGIVDLSQKSTKSLEDINKLDRAGNYAKALESTNQLIEENKALKEKALALSKELETMVSALDSVESDEARNIALQAISNRLAMISRLIEYSNSLGQLLETLKNRFSGASYGETRTIKLMVEQINSQVNTINSFDQQARQAMNQFDAIVKQEEGK